MCEILQIIWGFLFGYHGNYIKCHDVSEGDVELPTNILFQACLFTLYRSSPPLLDFRWCRRLGSITPVPTKLLVTSAPGA